MLKRGWYNTFRIFFVSMNVHLTSCLQGFMDVLVSDNSPHAAIANPQKKMYGLQFHPEVRCIPPVSVVRHVDLSGNLWDEALRS